MKRHYKFYLFTAFAIAFSASIISANTFDTNTRIITSNDSDNWVEIQNKNGIKVLFTRYLLDGNSYLKIKFENQTKEKINFNWSLTNKDSKVLINNQTTEIIANKAIIIYDATMQISINNGETLNDFSININIK